MERISYYNKNIKFDRKALTEVYEILKLLGEKYIKLLPIKLYRLICDNRDKKYEPIYHISCDLEKQNISKDSLAFLTLISLKYWIKDEKEKNEFWEQLSKKA